MVWIEERHRSDYRYSDAVTRYWPSDVTATPNGANR